ncbi:MAG: hypothetical protein AB7P49_12185, partial [Bdellovibrionales bacterium]
MHYIRAIWLVVLGFGLQLTISVTSSASTASESFFNMQPETLEEWMSSYNRALATDSNFKVEWDQVDRKLVPPDQRQPILSCDDAKRGLENFRRQYLELRELRSAQIREMEGARDRGVRYNNGGLFGAGMRDFIIAGFQITV